MGGRGCDIRQGVQYKEYGHTIIYLSPWEDVLARHDKGRVRCICMGSR